MGTVTVAQALEKVRRLLGEQQDSSGDYPQTVWTDQFLIDGMNQAVDRLERDGYWFFYKQDTSLTTSNGTNKYTIPSGVQEIESLYVGTVGAGLEYVPISTYKFDDLVAGTAYKVENDGTTSYIYLYPTPTSAETITIKHIARQTQLSTGDTTAVTEIPDRYHMFLVWSAVAYAHFRQEELQLKRESQQEADEIYKDIVRNEMSPGGQQTLRFQHPHEQLR